MKVRNQIIRNTLSTLGLAGIIVTAVPAVAADYSPFATSETDDRHVQKKMTTTSRNSRVISLGTPENPGLTDPFAESAEQIAELDKMQPIVENLEKAIEVHNIMNRLRSYRDTVRAYNDMKRLHDKSVEVLGQSEQCVVGYLGRYFNNPVKVWSGVDMSEMPQNHDLRTGLSAWAINAFEVAKSAQLSPISGDDVNSIGLISIDDELGRERSEDEIVANYDKTAKKDDVNLVEEKKAEMSTLIKDRDGIFFKEPSKQEEFDKDSRKINLIPTDIGAEASLMLAENPEKWGSMKKKFPVWNDQKSFYNQYLDGKYYNIEEFIRNAEITSSAKAKISQALLEDQRKFMSQAEYDVNAAALSAIAVTNAQYDRDYEALLKKYGLDVESTNNAAEKAITGITDTHRENVTGINEKLDGLYAERDAYAKDINAAGEAIASYKNSITSCQQDIAVLESELSREGVTDVDKETFNSQKENLSKEIDDANSEIERLRTQKSDLEKKYDELSKAIDTELAAIGKLDNQKVVDINQVNEKKDSALVVLNKDFQKQHQKLIKTRDDKIDKINKASLAAKAALQTNSSVTVQDIINTTTLIISIAKEDARTNIEAARQAFYQLGDDLYRGNKHEDVVGLHQALVESLKGNDASYNGLKLEGVTGKVRSITTDLTGIVSGEILDDSLSEMYINLKSKYIQDTNIILKVKLFDDLLKNVDDSADSRYFIGSEGKLEDFRAPMLMPDFNLPPFREYVHLDDVDLETLGKGAPKVEVGYLKEIKFGDKVIGTKFISEGNLSMIDKNKFLEYGARIPEIWKLMLTDKVFVETDFYLDSAMAPANKKVNGNVLRLGGETAALFRGGVYPCIMKNIKTQDKTPQTCDVDGMISDGTGVADVVIKSKGEEYALGLGLLSGEKRSALLSQNLPVCLESGSSCKVKLTANHGKLQKEAVPYLGFNNGETDEIENAKGSLTEGTYSELGTILAVNSGRVNGQLVSNLITFSPDMQSVYNYAERIKELNRNQQDHSFSGESKLNDDIYSRAPMIDNQIGDFLKWVENEETYRKALEDLKDSVEEMKRELLETLRSIGFVPTEDFDISQDKDFDLAKSKLATVKNARVSVAKEGVDSIKESGSELLTDSKNAYKKIVEALVKDKDAVTPMSTSVYESFSLDEEIKTGTVNEAVDSEYQKTADKSVEEQLKSFGTPYCAAY